jgi:uncharacterized RDD family membrane protein YckC
MNAEEQANRPNLYAPPQAEVGEIVDEQGELERANRGVRLGAAVIDGMIPTLAFVPLLIGVGLNFSGFSAGNGLTAFTIIGMGIAIIGILAWIGITIYFVNRNGQTIAKRMLGIKVVRSDGSPASLARIFWLRNVVSALPGGVPILGSVYQLVDSLFIFGERQQCIHDMIADTIVVKA